MKQLKLLLAATVVSLMAMHMMSCSSSKTVADKNQALKVSALTDSRHYKIVVDYMLPVQGTSKALNTNYSLTVKGDTLISYLPYFGRAYSVPYGGGAGLNFDAFLFDYEAASDEKGIVRIRFKSKSEGDIYRYQIQIFDNGKATIYVDSNNRQSITYYGKLDDDL